MPLPDTRRGGPEPVAQDVRGELDIELRLENTADGPAGAAEPVDQIEHRGQPGVHSN